MLAKYDHNEMYYIEDNSESVEQNVAQTYGMAVGGGGFAISYPLAEVLVKILDGCINRYAVLFGSDQKVHACMSEIGVQLTKEPGFHQVLSIICVFFLLVCFLFCLFFPFCLTLYYCFIFLCYISLILSFLS